MPPDIGSPAIKSCWSRVSFFQVTLITFILSTTAISGFRYPRAEVPSGFSVEQQKDKSEKLSDSEARSFIDEPLEELIKRVPELKTLQPAADQQKLPMILEKTGANVHELLDRLGSLVAKEKVTETRLNPLTGMSVSQANQYQVRQDEYSYFIVPKSNLLQTVIKEYRRDADGFEVPPGVLFLSTGFASSVLHFSSFLQPESTFRYLGEDHVGSRRAFVVAFAQIPEVATITFKFNKPDGSELQWLIQGIAWVDTSNFQILQMKTDLLAPESLRTENVPKDRLQTLVKFMEMRLNDLANSVSLPTEADVDEVLAGQEFRNVHHFMDYRIYDGTDNAMTALKIGEPTDEDLEENVEKNDAQAHPYLEEPLKKLVKRVPELKGMRPVGTQQALPMILERTGKKVDEFFDNLVDLIAQEEIKEENWNKSEVVRDNYLILRHGNTSRANIDEFRMDEKGNRMNDLGLDKGFFVTTGFALSGVHFSQALQRDSRFRYLGDQKADGRETYVVGFAQLPGQAKVAITLRGRRGNKVRMLSQGIVWVDKANFHILRLRTDLLARQPEIGLDEQTTKIKFNEVQLLDDGTPLWLPRDVNVYIRLTNFSDRSFGETFQNRHRYKNYRRYRVSARIVAPH